MLPPKQRLTIRSQILALVLVLVLPAAALVGWALSIVLAAEKDAATARVQGLAAQVANNLSLVLREREALLARLAERPAMRALEPRSCEAVVGDTARLPPEFITLAVRDRQGRLVCAAQADAAPPEQIRASAWFQQALRAGGFAAGPATAGVAGRWIVPLTFPLRDAAGAAAGLLILPLDLLNVQALVLPPTVKPVILVVIDGDDVFLMRSSDPNPYLGKPSPPGLSQRARGLRPGVLTGVGVDGVTRLYALTGVPGTAWRVVAGVPETEVLAPYRRLLAASLAAGALAIALVLVLAWRLGNRIVRPIRRLASVAEQVAAGASATRADTAGPVEIAAVAQQFNRMLDGQQRSQQALLASEAQHRFLIDHLFAGVVVHAPDGTVLLSNQRTAELLGLTVAQMTGKAAIDPAWRFVREDGTPMAPAEYPVARVLADHRPLIDFVGAIDHAGSGRRVWVLVNAYPQFEHDGSLRHVVVSFVDITARKQAEQTLARSEASYRMLFENSLDGVMQTRPDGTVLSANPAACAIFGLSEAEICRRGRAGLLDPQDPRVASWLAERARTGRADARLTVLRGDGSRFEAEVASSIYIDEAGEPLCSVVLRDISQRLADEQARARLEAQLRESQKMEAIGTLAGGIAHDFNNILGGLLGNVALARDALGQAHPARHSLDQIHRSGLRARALVQQILAFSRRQPTTMGRLPLGPLVAETLALLRATLPAGVQLEMAVADAAIEVLGDATQVQQVLMNLCTNAWHALAGQAGRIEVRLDEADLSADDAERPPSLAPGCYAHLRVSDTGCGIEPALLGRIFEPFFTTKPVGQGTGLGLSVAHGIVSAHQGVITVHSRVGEGSRFDVYLPRLLATVAGADADEASRPAHQAPGRGQHVLYVDDDEVMVVMTERLLQRAGYRVTCLQRAAEAIALLRQRPQDFDLVITDFNMPDGSGLEVARAAQQARADLPVVLTSGYLPEGLHADAQAIGVRAVLKKENTFEELVALVDRLLPAA